MNQPEKRTKVWLGLALAVLLVPVGFVAGGLYAAWTVTEMGLAAAGIYLGYMVIGVAFGVVAGILLAVALPYERLKTAVQGALVLAVLAAGVVAGRAYWLHQKDAAARAEVAALQPAPPKPVLPPPDSLAEPPPPPAGHSAAGPPPSEAWRHGTVVSAGLPTTGRTPDVAFYYPPRARLPLTRDDAYYYGLMPAAQSTRPCGGARVPSLFGADARLDLGTLSLDAIRRTAQANCETTLTAHGRGYARQATLSKFEVLVGGNNTAPRQQPRRWVRSRRDRPAGRARPHRRWRPRPRLRSVTHGAGAARRRLPHPRRPAPALPVLTRGKWRKGEWGSGREKTEPPISPLTHTPALPHASTQPAAPCPIR